MHKPNLKRKAPVKFGPLPLAGEKYELLLEDIAPIDIIRRLKEEDEKAVEGTKKFLEKLKKSR